MRRDARQGLLARGGRLCRTVAAALIGGIWRTQGAPGVERWLMRMPPGRQAVVVGTVMALLFALSFLAAQFGWLGMAVFWMVVILTVR